MVNLKLKTHHGFLKTGCFFFGLFLVCVLAVVAADMKKKQCHLFLLSGQSNMAGMEPDESFTPLVKAAFPDAQVVVVKEAHGAQPIWRWYRKWQPVRGKLPELRGDIYDWLMEKVDTALAGRKPDTVTFVWMQGESDARRQRSAVYGAALDGLYDQLREDLKREDINFVIGRINDYGFDQWRVPGWETVRKAQEEFAKAEPRAILVDTDDLNGPKNDVHFTKEGYKKLGKRFANAAIGLIRKRELKKTGKPSVSEKK